ncbi:poly(A) polymerase [Halioglobus japonicus]|uniref:Poly(A) polymerase I n=1 Tax=Halioglobus japonicus TaxID=930805 RepID=A0AAP8MDG4_9GAMM|nr:polynucleotide adenylyltransferase PcnB [Halioglobus japonicus]AQA17822.1 poly(A) polymerase [Halioglobus japonicus]PLW85782.1 polynucleotide adenylyltransferase PcnB [Halioglobus japonicus]GHD17475.1 poly(A) polymerase I [Halioglobus japonicus]
MNVIPRDQHCISRKHISDSALKVMSRLRGQGHQAYLVGGAVRDLLLGGHPKDFDIATDATPEEVHQLFRNSRIIGRRFRIVHVRFGREIIEVTTFRGHHDNGEADARANSGNHSRQSASGMLLRDNVYGTLEEDAVRRDLTVNALYYDAGTFEVYDHVHGLEDLEKRHICIIGDPQVRFREDPVRMLRAVRFAAKLDFGIDSDTAAAIPECAHLLRDIPAARLFDEFLKLFLSGYAAATLEQLLRHDLLQFLFPETSELLLEDEHYLALVRAAMANTDERIAQDKPVTPAFLLAALLWPVASRLASQLEARGEPPMPAMHSAAQQTIAEAVQFVSIPRRFSQPMREIWEFQLRLKKRQGKKAAELVEHRRFRAAYDFLLLREQAGEETDGLGEFWTQYQHLAPQDRHRQPERDGPRRRRRPRRRRSNKSE